MIIFPPTKTDKELHELICEIKANNVERCSLVLDSMELLASLEELLALRRKNSETSFHAAIMQRNLIAISANDKRGTFTRINHLRRMAERAYWLHGWYINGDPCTPTNSWQKMRRYKSDRLYRFYAACNLEIDRLRKKQRD